MKLSLPPPLPEKPPVPHTLPPARESGNEYLLYISLALIVTAALLSALHSEDNSTRETAPESVTETVTETATVTAFPTPY